MHVKAEQLWQAHSTLMFCQWDTSGFVPLHRDTDAPDMTAHSEAFVSESTESNI